MSLIGVTELTLNGRGPRRAFVFDEHRLALPCWASAAPEGNALLVSFDRHFDTVAPKTKTPRGLSLAELEQHAHRALDPRNFDHIPAALEGGILWGAILIARARLPGCVTDERIIGAPTLDALLHGPDAERALDRLAKAETVLLDLDLDCFTTPSDADPTSVVPWTEELIREHLLPRGSEDFWSKVLARCAGLTFAREPKHCGNLVATGRLFETAARVVFGELLRTDLP